MTLISGDNYYKCQYRGNKEHREMTLISGDNYYKCEYRGNKECKGEKTHQFKTRVTLLSTLSIWTKTKQNVHESTLTVSYRWWVHLHE